MERLLQDCQGPRAVECGETVLQPRAAITSRFIQLTMKIFIHRVTVETIDTEEN